MLNSDVDKLSTQALMAAVSIGIHKDYTSLGDTLLRTKWLGLRNASSPIDVSSLRPEIRVDLPSPPRTNFPIQVLLLIEFIAILRYRIEP